MSWLTKFLGYDFTIERLECQVADYRDLVNTKDENFASMLFLKDQEIQRLTNLILTEHGVLHESNLRPAPSSEHEMQPINAKFSWPKKQRELERKDRILAKQMTNEVAEYWEKKNAETASLEAK